MSKKLLKTYKTSDGKRISISNMGSYHLTNAIKKIVRQSITTFYATRRTLGYSRGLSTKEALRLLPHYWCHSPLYQSMCNELTRRQLPYFTEDIVVKNCNDLCRLEWSLMRQLKQVQDKLYK